MSDINPTNSNDDELLSAYLDGELTDDERVSVEQRLREDPSARKLLDELREISRSLQSLPQQSLDGSLREAVLQKALLAKADTVAVEQRSSMRRWLWAGLAVAAALMLMAYQPDESDEGRPLAEATPQNSQGARDKREAPVLRAPEVDKKDEMEAEQLAKSVREESAAASSPPTSRSMLESAIRPSDELVLRDSGVASDEAVDNEQSSISQIAQVHLTLNRSRWSSTQFDQLLNSNGITLSGNERSRASQKARPKSGVDSDRSSGLFAAAAEDSDEVSKEKPSTELVLVEAPLAQIEAVLTHCHADVANCLALSIATDGQKKIPTERWKRLQRNGRMVEQSAAEGVAEVLDSLDLVSKNKELGELNQDKERTGGSAKGGASAGAHRGWATRLHHDNLKDDNLNERQDAANKPADFAEKLSRMREIARDRKLPPQNDPSSVRVLFVLHWQDESPKENPLPRAAEVKSE